MFKNGDLAPSMERNSIGSNSTNVQLNPTFFTPNEKGVKKQA